MVRYCCDIFKISIHAPARGATHPNDYTGQGGYISIHAPARGATLTQTLITGYLSDFNPRSRKGSDTMSLSYPSRFDISIHAPARGATSFLLYSTPVEIFQSTLPQGERQRKSVHFIPNLINISIHAPARGATPFCFPYQRTVIQFQSTLPQGERPRLLQKTGSDWYFNPRSRKGSDEIYIRFKA